MKKVIYACFLLVASMSIVSCEKDDPKGKKDKEENKKKYIPIECKVYDVDYDNGYVGDTTFVYDENYELKYTVSKSGPAGLSYKYLDTCYYDKDKKLIRRVRDVYHVPTQTLSNRSFVQLYEYTYQNNKLQKIVCRDITNDYYYELELSYKDDLLNYMKSTEKTLDTYIIEFREIKLSKQDNLPIYKGIFYMLEFPDTYDEDELAEMQNSEIAIYYPTYEYEYDKNGNISVAYMKNPIISTSRASLMELVGGNWDVDNAKVEYTYKEIE